MSTLSHQAQTVINTFGSRAGVKQDPANNGENRAAYVKCTEKQKDSWTV